MEDRVISNSREVLGAQGQIAPEKRNWVQVPTLQVGEKTYS